MKIDNINPVVHLPLSAGSGAPQDQSDAGNNLHGTIGGTADWSSAAAQTSDYSVAFDGTSGYVDLGNSTTLVPSTAFSISIWAYASSFDNWHRMVSRYTTGGAPQYSYLLCTNNSEGKIRFLVYPSSNTGVGVKMITDNVVLSTGQWHHVVATYSGSDTRMRIYVDGTLVNSTLDPTADTTIPSSIRISTASTAIGSNYGGAADKHQTWNGYLDDFSLWDVELTAAQVTELYNYGARGGWELLNGLENVRDFTYGRNSNSAPISAYLTVGGGVSNVVITDDLRDQTELRTLEVASGGVEATSVEYIGDNLLAVGLNNSSTKIVAMSNGAETPSVAATFTDGAINGIEKIYRKKDASGAGLIIATEDGKVRFIDSIGADGTTNSGLSAKEFDISALAGSLVTIVDVELYNNYLAVVYRDVNFDCSVAVFNFTTESEITMTGLPFTPLSINYGNSLWYISNGESTASTSNLMNWQ